MNEDCLEEIAASITCEVWAAGYIKHEHTDVEIQGVAELSSTLALAYGAIDYSPEEWARTLRRLLTYENLVTISHEGATRLIRQAMQSVPNWQAERG